MQFSRNRFTKYLLIIVGILLIAGAGIYFYEAKVSADVSSDDTYLLNQIEQPDLADKTIIRLPDKYSPSDISHAQKNSSSGSKSLSSKDREINNYVKAQAESVVASLPNPVAHGNDPVPSDIYFRVASSNGQVISNKSDVSDSDTPTSVEDNFSFDPSVPQATQQLMIKAYPVIQSFYGPRQNSQKIVVVRQDWIHRAYASMNYIALDNANTDSDAVHELIHVFRGQMMMSRIWEEGSATFVSSLVMKKLNLPSDAADLQIRFGYNRSFENYPSGIDPTMVDGFFPYAYGSMMFDKIYRENPNFFLKFNSQIYASGSYPTGSQTLKMAILSAGSIEGQTSAVWFAHQYSLIPLYNNSDNTFDQYYYAAYIQGNVYAVNLKNDSFSVTIRSAYSLGNNDFSVRVLDNNNRELIPASCFTNQEKSDSYVTKLCSSTPEIFRSYIGVANIEMTPSNNPSNKKVQKFIESGVGLGARDLYLLAPASGTKAVFTSYDSADTATVNIKNGYADLSADWISKAGRYKVKIFNKNNVQLGQASFTKVAMKDFFLSVGGSNACKNTISAITPTNRAFTFNTTTSINCGQVVTVNNVPLFRYWGKSFSVAVNGLAKNRSYNYKIYSASDYSISAVKSGSVKTTNAADFKLLKVDQIGSPANDNYKIRITFNRRYKTDSVNLKLVSYLYGLAPDEVPLTATDDNGVLILTPTLKVLNNAYYHLQGLDKITGEGGQPVFGLNDDNSFFHTPVNGVYPTYQLTKSSYAANEDIVVNLNFQSTDLASRLSSYDNVNSSYHKINCTRACNSYAAQASLSENKITIHLLEPLAANATNDDSYYLSLPATVDNLNNFVVDNSAPFKILK